VPIISQLGLRSEVNRAISACISSGTDVCVCVHRGYRSSSGQRVIRNGTPTRGLCEKSHGPTCNLIKMRAARTIGNWFRRELPPCI